MKPTSDINLYSKLLSVRALFKQIQQTSWQVNSLEKRYPMSILSIDEQYSMLDTYEKLIDDLEITVENLKIEFESLHGKEELSRA